MNDIIAFFNKLLRSYREGKSFYLMDLEDQLKLNWSDRQGFKVEVEDLRNTVWYKSGPLCEWGLNLMRSCEGATQLHEFISLHNPDEIRQYYPFEEGPVAIFYQFNQHTVTIYLEQ